MNAFLDVQEDPISILEKFCISNTRWIIVHRQRIQKIEKSNFTYVKGYGGSQVPSSIMSIDELNNLTSKYCKEIFVHHWENDCYSFAMRIK